MRRMIILAGLAAALIPATASAGIPVQRRMTCPIGGESFIFNTTASYSTWGMRPDGRPYGSWEFPLNLPECPSNRLILYKDFEPEEITRLTALIARPEYRALGDDAQYYRLYWLMREMGGDNPLEPLWALVQASWEVEEGSAQRRRYLEELAAHMERIEGDPDSAEQVAMRAYWVNALRELGRFEGAAALLGRTATASLASDPDEDKRHWGEYFDMQRRLIERRDGSAEPLDVIPERYAINLCVSRESRLTQWDRAFCERESTEVERVRQERRD